MCVQVFGKEIIDTEQGEVLRGKSDIEGKLKKERDRYNMLMEMRMNNEIPKEVFHTKSEEVENKIGELESFPNRLLIGMFIEYRFPKIS